MVCLAVLYGTQALMGVIGSKIPSPVIFRMGGGGGILQYGLSLISLLPE